MSLGDLDNHSEGAGGHKIPCIGIIMVKIGAPFLGEKEVEVLALVVPTIRYSRNVPVIVGTNAIRDCKVLCKEDTRVPNEWAFAFVSLQQSKIGVVKSTNKFDIIVQPMETITLSGLIRKKNNMESAVRRNYRGGIQQTWRLSSGCFLTVAWKIPTSSCEAILYVSKGRYPQT